MMFRRLREWWHWFVKRNIIDDDPMDDERIRWEMRNREQK